jgi:raffinose/stachyose/melibiose transport system substrate-binding protein
MATRPLAALAVTTALVLTAAACSNTPAAPSGTGSSGGGGGTVTFASVSSDKAGVEAVAKAFTAKTGIQVTTTISDVDNYQTTLRTQLTSGTAPDVFFTWGGDGNPMAMKVVQKAGLIADLSDYSFAKEIPEGFKSVTSVDGKTYIAPTTTAFIGAAYNTQAMAKQGWKPPTTWSDMLKLCGTAKAAGKSLFAYAGATSWNTQLIPYALTPTLVYGPDPEFASKMSQGQATFADSGWVTAFDKYSEMYKADCFQANSLGTTYEDALKLVGQGKAMASVQVNSSMTAILQSAPDGTTMTYDPLPATDDASATRMAAALGAAYGLNAKAKNADGGKQLIEFLTSPEGQTAYATAATAVPVLPASSDYKQDPALNTAVKYLKEGKTDPFMDQLWPNAKVQQTHFEVLQKLLAGKESSLDAAKEMDKVYAQGS